MSFDSWIISVLLIKKKSFSLLLHQALASLQVAPANSLLSWQPFLVAPANSLLNWHGLNSDQNLRELTLLRRENGEYLPIENHLTICLKADSYICQVVP